MVAVHSAAKSTWKPWSQNTTDTLRLQIMYTRAADQYRSIQTAYVLTLVRTLWHAALRTVLGLVQHSRTLHCLGKVKWQLPRQWHTCCTCTHVAQALHLGREWCAPWFWLRAVRARPAGRQYWRALPVAPPPTPPSGSATTVSVPACNAPQELYLKNFPVPCKPEQNFDPKSTIAFKMVKHLILLWWPFTSTLEPNP